MRISQLSIGLGLIVAASLLTACGTTSNYQMALNTWQDAPIQQLILRWGPPMNSYIAPDGNRVYMFYQEFAEAQPTGGLGIGFGSGVGSGVTTGVGFGASNVAYGQGGCTTWVEVNKANRIIKTFAKGVGCRATNSQLKSLANPSM